MLEFLLLVAFLQKMNLLINIININKYYIIHLNAIDSYN